jgi:uncharacterized membrane protein YeaQ/YmgE (transglycosylase-associated protein family)
MTEVVSAWQVVAGVGGLAAALFTLLQFCVERVRSGSFTEAIEATWVTRREFVSSLGAALLGWASGVTILERHSLGWDSSLILGLAGALLFTTIYWTITRGGRSLVLLSLLIFLLPALTGFVVTY